MTITDPEPTRHETWDHYLTRADQDIAGWREQREHNLGYHYPHKEHA